MRGLLKASTLLIAPALASALIKDPVESVPSVLITLDIPNGVHAPRPLTLRLDVEERDEICGPANIKINDNALTIASQGYAHGELAVEDDSTIDASWQVSCVEVDSVPVEQIFSFIVHSIDGQTVPETSFDAYFRQTAPVFISDIEGASSLRRLTVIEGGDVLEVDDDVELDDVPETDDSVEAVDGATPTDSPVHQTSEKPATETDGRDEELEAQLADLEFLRIQAFELEEIIRQKEREMHERFGDRVRPPPPHHGPHPHTPLMDCTNVRCIVKSLTHTAKHTYHRVLGPGGFLHIPGGHHPPPPPHHGPGKGPRPPHHPEDPHHPDHPHPPPPPPPPPHHPEEPHHPDHPPPPPPPSEPEDPHHPHRPPPPGHRHDLPPPPPFEPREFLAQHNMTNGSYPQPQPSRGHGFPIPPFVLAVIGIVAVIYTIIALRNKGPCRKVYHHIRYGSRDDRRRGRTDTIGYIFHRRRRGGNDEERQAMIQQQHYGRIPEDETTIEQEIAQLREAANVVEGLVSAEEDRLRRPMVHPGRIEHANSTREMTQTAPRIPPAQSPSSPALQPPTNPRNESSNKGSLYSPYEDAELPAYEYDQVDSPMVSDGFRTATYMGYVPSEVASNADDVLGDSKN